MSRNGVGSNVRESTALAKAAPRTSVLAVSAGSGLGDKSAPVGATPPFATVADSSGTRSEHKSSPVGATPLTSAVSGESGAGSGAESASGGVRVDAVDVAWLCGPCLRARLGEIARAESQLAAMKADTLGEIARRSGDGAAAHAATHEMAVSGRRARGEVRDAVRLGELDATRAGLAAGSVPVGHAQLIARAAGDAPVDEAMLAALAQREGYDEFRRTVARHVADISADDGAANRRVRRQAGKRTSQLSDPATKPTSATGRELPQPELGGAALIAAAAP